MRARHPFPIALVAAGALMASSLQSTATEYAFSTYGLGGNAFGAGATPPPGTYVTEATAFYSASIGATVSFGGVTLNPGAKVDAFSAATNILYVPERKVLGGNLGLSVTIPVGHIDDTRNVLDSIHVRDGHAISSCGLHVQSINVEILHRELEALIDSLQQAEQQERDNDRQHREDRARLLAPQSRPDEPEVLHATCLTASCAS